MRKRLGPAITIKRHETVSQGLVRYHGLCHGQAFELDAYTAHEPDGTLAAHHLEVHTEHVGRTAPVPRPILDSLLSYGLREPEPDTTTEDHTEEWL